MGTPWDSANWAASSNESKQCKTTLPIASVEPIDVWTPHQRVRRVSNVTPDEVMQRHLLEGEGEPLIVTDAQREWFKGVGGRWTLESLSRDYGSERLIVNDNAPLQEWDDPPMRTRTVSLREYAAYARGEPTSLGDQASNDRRRWYMNSWEPFAKHPELLAAWSYPYFVEDLITHTSTSGAAVEPKVVNYSKIFIGVPGCTTRLHFDTQHTHAWLAQVQGRKQFVLFAPSDAEKLRLHAWEERASANPGEGLRRAVDPADPPDRRAYPRVYEARPFVATLSPGEIILVPCGWWHYARCLDVCITLMRNFANSANSERFKVAIQTLNDQAARHTPKRLVAPGSACVVCNSSARPVKPCSKCRAVWYCGRDCQKRAWPTHKMFCSILADLGLNQDSPQPNTTLKPSYLSDALFAPGQRPKQTHAKHILRQGRDGLGPNDESMVRVHYVGYLADGQKIDSSIDKGTPYDFHLTHSRVAKGWRDAMLTMRIGEKARIAIPPHAAYGDRGVEGKVPPNSALVFDVELLEVW